MGVTQEAGLSPQDPCGGSPAGWSRSAQVPQGNQRGACPAAPSGTETGHCRAAAKPEAGAEGAQKAGKADDMTDFMDELSLSSPQQRESPRSSRRSCARSSSRSSSRSSCSSRSSSSSSSSRSSRSWSRSRSRSRSRARRSRRSRRYSRSCSRSRSRSRGCRRYRSRYPARHYRHRYPRPRSRSRGRAYYRRSYSRSRSRSRGRRYYGFGRTVYPEAYRSWRSRSRTRSRSRSPLHLSEKDKRELLEIAKANAAKALGTDNIVLPASLKISAPAKEVKTEKQERAEATESAEMLREYRRRGLHPLQISLLLFSRALQDGCAELLPLSLLWCGSLCCDSESSLSWGWSCLHSHGNWHSCLGQTQWAQPCWVVALQLL
ncbi:PREDICTED: arginine/serine-rich protein 1 isoform X3 [Pseudopodoces humilis]|uniref:arginine/serine-rich protein 1 isoform X3 n=1 Tax=Pseudopodoces humilis TaxID=181119 RepID=UPI0006B79997|nr:PREDICTED: arginine/serine-rich protein 1 isoform X3 [Pseudopodoces humilis]